MKSIGFFILLLLFTFSFCYPETIRLKNGKIIEADIIERGDDYIKIDISGIPIKYYLDEIKSVGRANTDSSDIDVRYIRRILKELGYPEHAWSDIEQELILFLEKIDFSALKAKSHSAQSDPQQLKDLVEEVGGFFKQEGYLDYQSPRPLIALLVNSFGRADMVATAKGLSREQDQEGVGMFVFACPAVAQLGGIVLDLLGLPVKTLNSYHYSYGKRMGHVSNYIALNTAELILIDFLNQSYEIINLEHWYLREEKNFTLKSEYQLDSYQLHGIVSQWREGIEPTSIEEKLNALFLTLDLTNHYSASAQIYYVRGQIYAKSGHYKKAIVNYNRSFELGYSDIDAYCYCGIAFFYIGDYNLAISNYDRALRIDPNYGLAYYNRALAYANKGDYRNAWKDVHEAEALGYQFDPSFLQELRRRSGRNQ